MEDSTEKEAGGPASWSESDIQSWLLDQADTLNDGISRDITHDLFEQGFDRWVIGFISFALRQRLTGKCLIS